MDVILEQSAHVRLISPQDRLLLLRATLRYTSTDPLTVRVGLPDKVSFGGEQATWLFSRELLDRGLRHTVDAGDVRIWPCGRSGTVIDFHVPGGRALVQFDTAVLEHFLLSSYAAVAPGGNTGSRLDQGLTSLLKRRLGRPRRDRMTVLTGRGSHRRPGLLAKPHPAESI